MPQAKNGKRQKRTQKRNVKQRNLRQKVRELYKSRTVMVASVVVFALVGAAYLYIGSAQTERTAGVKPFVEDKQRGLVWKGLKADSRICPHGYYIADSKGADPQNSCTHGPDPVPEGLDVTRSVEPLSVGEESTTAETSGIVCDGDGVTGKRVEMIYAHSSDVPNRYADFASSFPVYAANMNKQFVESGHQTGSPRSIRFVTDANCNLVVHNVTMTPTGDDTFGNTKTELKNHGFSRTDRKYIVWVDAKVYCGIANISGDSTPGLSNRNNGGPTFGRVDSGCWGGSTEVHELVHTIGGVQLDAPNTSGGWHCNDNYDRLCYADGGSSSKMRTDCPDYADERRLDCNKNDYFNSSASIPADSYLYNHWNTANSSFLLVGDPSNSSTTPPPTTDTTLPAVTISSPKDGSVIGGKVTIEAYATDNVGVVKMEVYVDNKLMATSSSGSIKVNWNSRRASRGEHSITVKAYDAANNVGQSTVFVYK